MSPLLESNATRSEERRVGKEYRSLRDWSSDVCSSDLCTVNDTNRFRAKIGYIDFIVVRVKCYCFRIRANRDCLYKILGRTSDYKYGGSQNHWLHKCLRC